MKIKSEVITMLHIAYLCHWNNIIFQHNSWAYWLMCYILAKVHKLCSC